MHFSLAFCAGIMYYKNMKNTRNLTAKMDRFHALCGNVRLDNGDVMLHDNRIRRGSQILVEPAAKPTPKPQCDEEDELSFLRPRR